MTFLKHLFGSRKPDQTMHGSAPQQSDADQEAVRERMEREVTQGKAQRAAKAVAAAEKDRSG